MEDVTVPVPGGSINVWHRRASGTAGTAVLVHGLSGNSRWWTSVIEHLSDDLGVIALDVRGRAGSVEAPPPFDLTTISDDVARSLDHFDVPRAVVAGYSMGGWVAAIFGATHADRVERIVLIDGGLPLPMDSDTDPESFIDAMVGPSLRRLEIDFDSEESYFELWKSHPALEKHWDDAMRPALGHELAPESGGFAVRSNAEAIEVGAREITVGAEANAAASRLSVATHLIVVERGTTDQPGGMIPLQTAEDAATANPELTMEYLPGLNHYTLVLGSGAAPVAAAIDH